MLITFPGFNAPFHRCRAARRGAKAAKRWRTDGVSRQALSHQFATEVTAWCWKCPHGFSPWIFRSQKWQRLEKQWSKQRWNPPALLFCRGQALLLKEDIWCYPSPVPWDMTPRPHSGLPRAPAQPWLPSAAKTEALPVQRVGPPCCGRFQQLNCKQITKRKNVIRVQRCKANHP